MNNGKIGVLAPHSVFQPGNNMTNGAAPQRERSLIETMHITRERLEDIERKVGILHNWIFGPEPQCDECEPQAESNIRSLADHAFGSTVQIERMLDEIRFRLAE
ncbi:MAG: hypothetical protein ACE3L7_25575 [Candidatus Pristimantibacillus sp.]